MRVLPLILALLFSKFSVAQFEFPPDSSKYTTTIGDYQIVDSIFNLSSDNDFEVRLGIVPFAKIRQLFVLSFKKNVCSARFFQRSLKDTIFVWKEVHSIKDPVQLWRKLKKNNLLTLKRNEELLDDSGKELDLSIMDGVHYHFRLFNNNGTRSYIYHCPRMWSKDFPKVPEFKRVINIIMLIYDFFKPKYKLIC